MDRHLARLQPPSLGLGLRLGLGSSGRGQVYLDFAAGVIPSGASFTRASTGTYFDGAIIQTAAINVARFESSCLLYEPQRIGLALRNTTMDHAYWDVKSKLSVTPDAATSPDGTATADKLVEDNTTGEHVWGKVSISASNATVYSVSFFIEAAGRTIVKVGDIFGFNGLHFYVNLTTGAVSGTAGGTSPTISTVSFGNGRWRVIVTDTSTATEVDPLIALVSTGTTTSYAGDGASGCYLWGYQFEAGTFASSFIYTVASQATRAADALIVYVPPGVSTLRFTFDDDSTQDKAVTPGAYAVPTNLNRTHIKRIVSL